MTACHRLRGGIFSAYRRRPRMSPRPRVAKYGATHGCHHLPGWLKCPPLVIVSAVGGEADSALRPTTALRFGCYHLDIAAKCENFLHEVERDENFIGENRVFVVDFLLLRGVERQGAQVASL